MKNLIMGAGAVILIFTLMQYQFQLNHLLRQKQNLKFAADEAAATASLCFDDESFGQGMMTFDRSKATEKAAEIIGLNLSEAEGKIVWNIDFQEAMGKSPKVSITIRQGRLKAMSEYEQVPFGITKQTTQK